MKKYELIDSDISGLYRIRSLIDFSNVKKGDIGGYVEYEINLSQCDNAWVYNNARVSGNARVYDNARVSGNARVYDNARVSGNAHVYGKAHVSGNARVLDNARVSGNARVYGDAHVYGKAHVYGNAHVSDDANVYGNARVYGDAHVSGNARVLGNARVYGKAHVYGNAHVCEDAMVSSIADYIVFKNFWSSGRYFTFTFSNKLYRVGCFLGTGDELIKKAYQDSEVIGREYERVVNYVNSILKDREKNENKDI